VSNGSPGSTPAQLRHRCEGQGARRAIRTGALIVSSLTASAEERYIEFLNLYPSIALRVPQSMLASYLGMSPETPSRIRKKLSRRLVNSE
jgi:hypothetical protein